jgi:hypothetical protein
MMPLTLFFLLKITLSIQGFLWLQMHFRIVLTIFVKDMALGF